MSNRLKALDVLEGLELRLIYLPGGRDREGHPLVIVNVPSEPSSSTKTTFESLFRYMLSIFSEETKSNGLTILVDARRGAWRVARACIRQATGLSGSTGLTLIVLRPDGFWDKHVDNCTKSRKDIEPLYIPITRLSNHVEPSQLPSELGGSKSYDHVEWIQTRIHVENYLDDAGDFIVKLSDIHQRLRAAKEQNNAETEEALKNYTEFGNELRATARQLIHSGRHVVASINRDSGQDARDTVQRVNALLDVMEVKQVEIVNASMELERHLVSVKEIRTLEEGVASVTNWILGPADSMLNSRHQVGFDVASSEELRREHEALELRCRETYGRYAELLHKIDNIPDGSLPEDLESQRDFMDFVCRSFASRLERRRNVLITSQRFFRLVSEYFDRTSEVFDKLVMGNKVYNFSQAGAKLLKLEKNQAVLEAIERELVKEGEKLSDILSMPVKDALGREICVDYGEDIVNVRDILDATNARKNIFSDSVELQKLTLKQVALIHTYEKDSEQAIQWIGDLYKVLVKSHVEIGCNVNEIQSQKEEHLSFQDTAKGTYEYGCQLLNGARVLRMSCRLPLEDNTSLSSRLWQAWRQLRSVGQEQLTRLRVCAVFHRSVEDHCARLRALIDIVSALRRSSDHVDARETTRNEIREVLADREKLLMEVGRMVRLGRLLRSRLKEPLGPQRMSDDEALVGGGNLTAVEAISSRLADVTRLAERLDSHLCEAGAKSDGTPPPSKESPSTSTIPSKDDEQPSDVPSGARKILDEANIVTEGESIAVDKEGTDRVTSPEEQEEPVKDTFHANVVDESAGDDYATATECSTTPVIQSRTASFTTASECGDALWWDVDVPTSDVENIEIPELKTLEDSMRLAGFETTPTGDRDDKRESNELPVRMESVRKMDVPEIDRSSATSSTIIRQTTQEKSGKIFKEVTETTTLRVSQSTHFGVTSYKLTSNTLNEAKDHDDVVEIQDLKGLAETNFGEKCSPEMEPIPDTMKRIEYGVISKTTAEKELEPIPRKKDSLIDDSSSESSSETTPREHSRLLKFTKALSNSQGVEDSLEIEPSEERIRATRTKATSKEEMNSFEGDEKRRDTSFEIVKLNDSGIEMTPTKNTTEEEDKLMENVKMVSRRSVVCGNCEDSKSSNGLINHCLIAQRAVRSAARFDFMFGEIC